MRVRISAVTHRGLVRDHNEDCLGWSGWAMNGEVTQPLSLELTIAEPLVVVVCDGMGGHAGGETASRLATTLLTAPGACVDPTETGVTALLQQASDAINTAAEHRPDLTGMGCTSVGVVVRPDGSALVFNVGDSRCYRIEGRYLAQLSVDHRHPVSGGLTQALGGGRRVILEPDYFSCDLPSGPGLLLCTDGLDDYAEFSDIEALVLRGGPHLVTGLRDLALSGKGGDNVSILQVSMIEGDSDRG
ncbi:PP2C family serine/threonine-protein phosphatase [Williamsia sp.]|uniref:PP2C family protein-serine/threonine phosphatase n=1 Tax=Williamsia sp. TaxID=1872085 RepID=UPI002F925F37